MPSLRLFGRRWAIGSDDFVFPGLASAMLRGTWAIGVAVLYYFLLQHKIECGLRHKTCLFLLLFVCINLAVG